MYNLEFINVDLPFDKLDFWDMYSSTFQNVVHFILIVVMIYFIKVFFPLCPFPYRNYMALFNCQNLSDYYFFLFDHHNAIHEGRRHITCKSPVQRKSMLNLCDLFFNHHTFIRFLWRHDLPFTTLCPTSHYEACVSSVKSRCFMCLWRERYS